MASIKVRIDPVSGLSSTTRVELQITGMRSHRGPLFFSRQVPARPGEENQAAERGLREIVQELDDVRSALARGDFEAEIVPQPPFG